MRAEEISNIAQLAHCIESISHVWHWQWVKCWNISDGIQKYRFKNIFLKTLIFCGDRITSNITHRVNLTNCSMFTSSQFNMFDIDNGWNIKIFQMESKNTDSKNILLNTLILCGDKIIHIKHCSMCIASQFDKFDITHSHIRPLSMDHLKDKKTLWHVSLDHQKHSIL